MPYPVVGKKKGVRAFHLDLKATGGGVSLRSLIVDYSYGGPVAINQEPPVKYPNPRHVDDWTGGFGPRDDKFGFYAYRVGDERAVNALYVIPDCGMAALGLVEVFGGVWEHERGFRAQGLSVHRLAVLILSNEHSADVGQVCDGLERRYRCCVSAIDAVDAVDNSLEGGGDFSELLWGRLPDWSRNDEAIAS